MIDKSILVPPSKSLTHRALFCASLARGRSLLINPLLCEDTQASIHVLRKLGIIIEEMADGWLVRGGSFQTPEQELFCNESGTTLRFLTAITSALNIPCRIGGKASLLKRPMKPLLRGLQQLGSQISLEGNISSQFLSALLLAAPLTSHPTTLSLTTPLVSKPYVDLTLQVQKAFGVNIEQGNSNFNIYPQSYQPTHFAIEGDWSTAAFWLATGVLGGTVALRGLHQKSLQGDRQVVLLLKEMGGVLFWEGDRLVTKKSALRAISWDLTDTPDLFPIVSILCAVAKGRSHLRGIGRLQFKESNRPRGMLHLLKNSGIPCGWEKEEFWIEGGNPRASLVDSKDHRIIMAAAILGLVAKGEMKIEHPEGVNKSYPGFWKDF